MNRQFLQVPINRAVTRGFTLVELMITLAVIGIAAIVVLPQMGQMTQANKMTEYINILSRDIAYARGEAITRGEPVQIASNNTTTPADWTQGWQISVVNSGTVLRTYGATGTTVISGVALNETNTPTTATAGTITFSSTGSVDNTATISLCDNTDTNTKKNGKQLVLNAVGRVQIPANVKSTSTGAALDAAGNAICP